MANVIRFPHAAGWRSGSRGRAVQNQALQCLTDGIVRSERAAVGWYGKGARHSAAERLASVQHAAVEKLYDAMVAAGVLSILLPLYLAEVTIEVFYKPYTHDGLVGRPKR